MGLTTLLLVFLAVLVAATGHGTAGFGFALVGVPLLTLVVEPRTAVVTVTTLGLLMTGLGWWRHHGDVAWPPVARLSGGAVVGIPLGLLVFSSAPTRALSLAIGVTVLLLVALMVARVSLPAGPVTQVAAGTVSGAMLSTTGINGPPLVLALQAARLRPRTFRATLQPIFTLQAVVVAGGFLVLGQYTASTVALVAVGVPALWVGWRLGDLAFGRLSAGHARALVLGTLAVSGTLVVLSALGGA